MSLKHQEQKDRARQEAMHHAENSTVDGMRSRYKQETRTLDKAFEQSDAEHRAGMLNDEQYKAEQRRQETHYKERIKDIPSHKRDQYADEMMKENK